MFTSHTFVLSNAFESDEELVPVGAVLPGVDGIIWTLAGGVESTTPSLLLDQGSYFGLVIDPMQRGSWNRMETQFYSPQLFTKPWLYSLAASATRPPRIAAALLWSTALSFFNLSILEEKYTCTHRKRK